MTEKSEALRLVDVPFALREGLWHTQADHVLLNLHADNNQLQAQRDALLEKINGVLAAHRSEGGGCGGFINKPPTREHQRRVAQAWQELHEVIKAWQGEKT